jgi:DNA-binding NtrC family response regulator
VLAAFPDPRSTPTENVLVVDDDAPVRKLVARILGAQGYSVHEVADGATARRILATQSVALVFCDVNLAKESGLALAEEMLSRLDPPAVVMLSGVLDLSVAERALGCGAYGYVMKPFGANDLLVSAANALHRRRLESEARGYEERLRSAAEARTVELRHDTLVELALSELDLAEAPIDAVGS